MSPLQSREEMQSTFLKEVTPHEVFAAWEVGEGQNIEWQQVAKEKGWDSWHEWRFNAFKQLKGDTRTWKLYEISHPQHFLPNFLIGPTQSWQQHFEKPFMATFNDLAKQQPEWVQDNRRVAAFVQDFPQGTQIIAGYFPTSSTWILLEGHHRIAALALANELGKTIEISKPMTMAVTEFSENEWELFETFLEKGTTKDAYQ